jgi:ribosomal protein S18 acetylase RimI-like enzyme
MKILSLFKQEIERPERVIPLENIGMEVRNDHVFERIIAGDRIPDNQRKAYNRMQEKDGIHLLPIDGFFSGSKGFVDFSEIRLWNQEITSLYLAFIGVEPSYRNRNIGTSLVNAVEKTAIERGVGGIWAYVDKHRVKTVFPFFEKLGYKIGGEREDCYLISKSLE